MWAETGKQMFSLFSLSWEHARRTGELEIFVPVCVSTSDHENAMSIKRFRKLTFIIVNSFFFLMYSGLQIHFGY